MTKHLIDPEAPLHTEEMKALRNLALTKFRERGRGYDENCDMPVENIQELHEGGWLRNTLSKARGGRGSNLDTDDPATYLQAQRTIAQGCPGTAHCVQVSNHTAWCLEAIGSEDQKKRYLDPMREKPFLGAFVGSEAKRKHMYMMNTTARKVLGGWVIRGEKNYATNAPTMGFAIIFVALDGSENYNQNHQMIIVEPGMQGVTMDHTWYRPNGMRAAPSSIITLDVAFVTEDQFLGEPGAYPRQRWQGKFHLGFAATYLGATEGMYDWCVDYLRQRGRGRDPIAQLRIGEMKIALEAARASFHHAIACWKTKPVVEAELASMAAKSTAAHVAFELSHKLIHASGSTALFDEYPLARYLRDLETHVLHAGHDRTAQIIGQAELGESFDSTLQR
jgi:alkylation response protein AidB-like acyl-CoA dehydrogenase